MVLNIFNRSRSTDLQPLFGQKINNNVHVGTKDLIARHIDAIYAELREDLKNSPRGDRILSLSPQDYRTPQPDPPQHDAQTQPLVHIHQYPCAIPGPEHRVPQQTVPQHSVPQHPIPQNFGSQHPIVLQHPTPRHPYPAPYDMKIPQQFQGGYHQDDSDGPNHLQHGAHPGHTNGRPVHGLENLDSKPLPPSGDRLDISQELPPREDRDQDAALRAAIREAFTPKTDIGFPSIPLGQRANADFHFVNNTPMNLRSVSCPQQGYFRSRNQVDELERRSFEPHHSTGHIRHPTPDNSFQENPASEALQEVTNKILHWVEACQKRLLCLPGVTIAKFRQALNAIPPEIHLGDRYMPELEKLAKRLERLYWQMMKHDDFQYIRSTCDGAQMRVEAWSKNFRLAKHLSSMEKVTIAGREIAPRISGLGRRV